MRAAQIIRKTNETDIKLELALEGTGQYRADTGCGFLNHMLELFARHGRFDLGVRCTGDVEVDYHHTVEDIGIALGQAFARALGDKRGVARYGSFLLPMDEALSLVAVDLSGRGLLAMEVALPSRRVGDFDTELVREFFLAFAREAGVTLHLRGFCGENTHHVIESLFKGFGRAMKQAVAIDPAFADEIPSS